MPRAKNYKTGYIEKRLESRFKLQMKTRTSVPNSNVAFHTHAKHIQRNRAARLKKPDLFAELCVLFESRYEL